MKTKQKAKPEEDEDDFENEDEEDSDEDEDSEIEDDEVVAPKKSIKPVQKSKLTIGEIRPVPTGYNYYVFKGLDSKDEEQWIPCESLAQAEILSKLLS